MNHYTVSSIEKAWKFACFNHLETCEVVMDSGLNKGSSVCLTINEPGNRVPSRATNPFIPFWLSVLGMTEQDQDANLIKKYIPEIADFRDEQNRFSLSMGARLREFAGFDQFRFLHETLRLGTQVLPATIFDASVDNTLQHRPSTLSLVFSILAGRIDVMVTVDTILMHDVPFHSELSVVSMWQEMLAAYMGIRVGKMNVVCGATSAMQSDSDEFRKIVDEDTSPSRQNLPVMGTESDPEVLTSDFKTWPLVGVGRGYLSDFFKHTVIPMAMVTRALKKDGPDLHTKCEEASQAALAIHDVAWRDHVTFWINNYFVE